MTAQTRRQRIEAMLQDEPHDVFLRYSLAMEMSGAGETEAALEIFNTLCKEEPPHVPAFFRSAQILVDEQQIESARGFLRDGIDQARQQGDQHAAAEMSELLADLGQGNTE